MAIVRRLVALALLLSAVPCFSEDVVTRFVRHKEPDLGVPAKAAPGDQIYVEYEQTETMWAKLKSDARVSESGMILPKGLLLECDIAHGSGQTDCCKGYEAALYCLQDRDHNGRFDKVKILGGGRPFEYVSAPYEIVYQPKDDLPRWRKSVVYQGVAGGVLHLTYEEISNGAPKSTRELTFDVAKDGPTDVVYQGLHLVFSTVDSAHVEYSVTAPFRERQEP